ncbi:MAG: hypothetical protein QM731_18365 [Chitinophagaceae bacterium]
MCIPAKRADYSNQLLHLHADGKINTAQVIENFFDCYDLQEVHEILWGWMTEAITSHRDIADEPRKRKDIISFYENISVLVEAAFVADNKKQMKDAKPKKHRKDK